MRGGCFQLIAASNFVLFCLVPVSPWAWLRNPCSSSGGDLIQRNTETSGGDFKLVEGQVQWWQQRTGHTPLQFFGTIDRRRALTRIAVPMVREFFPNALLIDYEALTAALPSDYCIDGEHWGCPRVAWQGRQLEPFQCKSLGNIVFANIIANIICNNPR